MSTGYTTSSGRVSRPPKLFGADQTVGPERPYVPYIPRRRRSRANFSLEATGESYHGASEVDSRELGALRVGDNDEGSVLSTSSPWNESERLQREIDLVIGLDGGRVSPKDDNVEADKAARDGSYGSLASLSQWKQRYGESPRDNVPSLGAGDRRWVAGAPMAASGAGSSGIELVASTRSPLWRGHSEKRAEPSRPDWVASHVQEAPQGVELNVPSSQLLAHGGPESSSNVLGIVKTKDSFMPSGTTEQSSTMDKYLRKDEIPRIHKVLVPDAYEASRRTSDGRRVPGRALEASRPRAEQPPPTQPMRTYFWDSVRNKVKPVSSWLTEASASMSRRLEEEVTPSKPDGAPVSTGMHWQRKRPHERARPEYEEEIRRQMTAERDELDLQAALQKAHIEMLEQQIKQLREEANAPKEVQRPAEAVPSALKAVPSTKEVSAPETLANLARTVQPTIRRAHERAEPGKGRKGPDSPLSDDSGDESSSSEDDSGSKRADKRRERDKKARKAAIKAIHLNRPRGYDGEAVYDKYESWMDTFMDWRNLHDLSEYSTMVAMSMVLTGDAKDWYILNVRGHEKEWRLEDVSVEMYQGLFPDEQASFLREAFEKSRQGEKSLKKWHRSLGKLSKRVKFVTEHEFRRRFWYGSAIYLQSEWAKIGLHPEKESTTIAAMLEAGLRFERARKYEETAAKRIELNAVRPKRVAFVSEPDDSSEGESKTPENESSDGGRIDSEEEALTESEDEQQKAEVECFKCHEMGHIARNWPQRSKRTSSRKYDDRSPTAYSGSMLLSSGPARKQQPVIRLNAMVFDVEESSNADSEGASEAEVSDAGTNVPTSMNVAVLYNEEMKYEDGIGSRERIGMRTIDSEGEDGQEEVKESMRGRGKPRKSVLRHTTKPKETLTEGGFGIAPQSSTDITTPETILHHHHHPNGLLAYPDSLLIITPNGIPLCAVQSDEVDADKAIGKQHQHACHHDATQPLVPLLKESIYHTRNNSQKRYQLATPNSPISGHPSVRQPMSGHVEYDDHREQPSTETSTGDPSEADDSAEIDIEGPIKHHSPLIDHQHPVEEFARI